MSHTYFGEIRTPNMKTVISHDIYVGIIIRAKNCALNRTNRLFTVMETTLKLDIFLFMFWLRFIF